MTFISHQKTEVQVTLFAARPNAMSPQALDNLASPSPSVCKYWQWEGESPEQTPALKIELGHWDRVRPREDSHVLSRVSSPRQQRLTWSWNSEQNTNNKLPKVTKLARNYNSSVLFVVLSSSLSESVSQKNVEKNIVRRNIDIFFPHLFEWSSATKCQPTLKQTSKDFVNTRVLSRTWAHSSDFSRCTI